MSDELFRILLVEDNAADVYLFRKALEHAGLDFELIVIQDGADALAFVRAEGKYATRPAPVLAVLDLNLPKNEGMDVLRAIRQSEHLRNMPVVIASSSPDPRDYVETDACHAERYIMKPIDVDEFMKIGLVLKQVILDGKART